jgi:outer membrane protein OmpA-like peptidoglycan-associated protein
MFEQEGNLSMTNRGAISAVAALLGFCAAARAQEPDAEGCRDSSVLSRMPGCRIAECDVKDFDAAEVQVGPQNESGFPRKTLEGRKEVIRYVCGENVSSLQLVRNAEGALRKAGYTIVFSGKVEAGDEPGVTAHKAAQWVQVAGDSSYAAPAGGYVVTAVRTKEMAQEMIATAEGLAAEIGKSGRVAVYGINFDTGKSTIKPDSDAVLGEVAKLLKGNPTWKVKVEGHTDNVGAKDANKKLSEDRAEAVEKWLVAHGVDKARLSHEGFGDTRPAADNSTEEGRAKNRRVELAKIG